MGENNITVQSLYWNCYLKEVTTVVFTAFHVGSIYMSVVQWLLISFLIFKKYFSYI